MRTSVRLLVALAVVLGAAAPASAQNCYTLNGAMTCAQPINLLDSSSRQVSTPVVNTSQTWANGGTTFTGWKLNVTNVGSSTASKLIDLQVGGTSKFSVDLQGNIALGGTQFAKAALALTNSGTQLLFAPPDANGTTWMQVFKGNNGTVTGGLDARGNFHTNLAMFISGGWSMSLNADGSVASVTSATTGLSDMLDIIGDTNYGVVSKGSSTPGQIYTGLDQNANQVFNVDPTGFVQSKGPAVTAGTDVTGVGNIGTITRTRYQSTITPASGGAGNCGTSFAAAALTADCTVATLPAGSKLVGVYADITVGFTCSGTCTGTKVVQCGTAAGGVQVLAAGFNVAATGTAGLADADLGSSMTRAAAIQGGMIGAWGSTTPISCRFTSGTGNWGSGAATFVNAGAITFTLITEQVK